MAEKTSNTPYDDAFRTMVTKSGNLRLPFINEMFHPDSPLQPGTPIENVSNEYFIEEGKGNQREVITDSVLHIAGKTYHIECQSFADGTILVRMFEYDVTIGLKESEYSAGHLTVTMPHSGVLFLRKASNTPDKMLVTINTEGGNVEYEVKALYLADYALDDLIEKNLLFLFPFYMFNLEGEMKKAEENNAEANEKVVSSFTGLIQHVNDLYEKQAITFENYLLVTDMLRKVTDALTKNYDNVRKELDGIMGGKVLEFKGEKIFREGEATKAKNIAISLIRKGQMTDADIADTCGLTEDEVKALREQEMAMA